MISKQKQVDAMKHKEENDFCGLSNFAKGYRKKEEKFPKFDSDQLREYRIQNGLPVDDQYDKVSSSSSGVVTDDGIED